MTGRRRGVLKIMQIPAITAPIKRVVQEARERGMLLDASFGRRTKSVLLMDTDHVILSSVTPETICARMEEKSSEETNLQP